MTRAEGNRVSGGNSMTDNDAFDEGYDAYWDGLSREDNPYEQEKEPEKQTSWDEGWAAARKHDYDESEG
jgi:ribosome modulation factor